ncbi:MAG: Holliday junction resolvase RuvX [Clostridia bacterium]|nr:Holliday junction resolvase RuvX [Clostridia bacterium]
MERFLCLDIGDKRIGVAVSDPFNTYALPVQTYFRKNLKTDLAAIGGFVKEKSATAIVCGLPVSFDGTPSVQTEKAQYFIDRLKEELKLPIYPVDERCTTVEAEETLIAQGKSRQERKQVIDALAACEILDGFLRDYNNKKVKNFKENTKMGEKEKHIHGEGCDCGCEHEHDHCDDHCDCGCEDDIVELTADDGRKLKFYFVGTIEYKGKNYSAFEPAEEIEGISEDDLVIFELSGDDEESAELLPIEDEKLLDEVFEEFCKALDEEEDYEEEK